MDLRVLVADNDDSLAKVYQKFLELHGFDVAVVTSGIECLEMLPQFRPDALLLDRDLLWGGGDGVLSWLRDDRNLLSTHVVLVADASPNELEYLIAAPVVAAIRKPFRLRTLLELIQEPVSIPVQP